MILSGSVVLDRSGQESVLEHCTGLAARANAAQRRLALTSGSERAQALGRVADRLLTNSDTIQEANRTDLSSAADMGLSESMLERLTLDRQRIEAMADSVRKIAAQTDPIGHVMAGRVLQSGIRLSKVRVPIGVVFFIFESRPNVTSDAASLCIKSGNAVILRGGKEANCSNAITTTVIRDGLADVGLDPNVVQLVQTTDRAAVAEFLKMEGQINLCIPRGGESLIRAVSEQARIPVIKHYAGNCHVYVDGQCDDQMAVDICVNAKTQRPSVCNAAESLLIHQDAVQRGLLNRICDALGQKGVEIRGDAVTRSVCAKARAAKEDDWSEEYLDLIVTIRVVDNFEEALEHISRYGSQHTDAIVTNDVHVADQFVMQVDSANVFVNCSTRFSDGGEYGLGAEIGISTDKFHARGPMGAADLTTYKWVARGDGQVRT